MKIRKLIGIFMLCTAILLCSCVKEGKSDADAVNVFVEIECKNVLENMDLLKEDREIPEDGIILEKTQVEAKENDSALEVLKKIAKDKKIHVDATETYAKGINNLYEKDCGDMSGWVYTVNGESIMEAYTVNEGDTITWTYICDFSAAFAE